MDISLSEHFDYKKLLRFTSATISFLRVLVFQIIIIFAIPYFFSEEWIWIATACAELLGAIVTITFLIKNRHRYHYA